MGVRDDHVHQAMRRHRVLPGERLVDAGRAAVLLQAQVLGAVDEAQMRAVQRRVGRHVAMGLGVRGGGLGVGRLEAEAARRLDRAEQDLQHVQRAAGLEAVRMGADAAHGVEADGAALHRLVAPAPEVGPGDGELERLLEGHAGELGGVGADAGGRDAGAVGDGLGRVGRIEIPVDHRVEDGAVRDAPVLPGAVQVRVHVLRGVEAARALLTPAPYQRVAVVVAHGQALRRPVPRVEQHGRVGEVAQIGQVDPARLEEAVDDGEDEEAVGARRDAEPVVCDGVVAGPHGVHADDARALRLDLADAHLDRVAVMVLGHAEQREHAGAVPVGLPELPEGAAHRVDARRRHVDGAESAMRRVVRRPEGLRPPGGEGLRLVAAGEEGELAGIVPPDRAQDARRYLERLLPRDLLELARSAGAGTAQGRAQARGRVVLHDASAALRAEHASIDRVVAVALDIGDARLAVGAVLQVDVDAAAAGAHVAGRLRGPVARLGVQVRRRCGHRSSSGTNARCPGPS